MPTLPDRIRISSPGSTPPDPDSGWRDLLEAVAEEDGVAAVSEGLLRALTTGSSTWWTANAAGDHGERIVGIVVLAQQGERLAGELAVHPSFRRQGIGRELLRVALTHQRSVSGEASHEEAWFWAHGDHPGAARLAHDFGLRRARVLLQMRRATPADGFAAPRLEDGTLLRTFRVGEDEPEWLRVNNAAFSWHPEQGHQTIEDLRRESADEEFDAEGFFLAVPADDPGRVLGFHQTKIHPDTGLGEVYVLGVDPEAHARGLGRALTLAGLGYLHSRGVPGIQLYVEGDNEPALGLYRSLGFEVHATDVSYTRSPA